VKPVDGAGGQGIVIGPRADRETLRRTRKAVAADPRGFIAQRPVALSTSPTLSGDRMAPRHIDLRPFAVNDGSRIWVLPGGLTRVALPEGELVVNSSQGGGSKDTWVMTPPRPAAEPVEEHDVTRIEFTTADLPAEPPGQDPGPVNDNAIAQSQQQQQLGGSPC
jgi:uncharacterized circularly permuted ATP-grasp superfamily protein